MYRPRIIPALLLKRKGLVKTVKFKKPKYIGDPINAVKIFNDLKADELMFLDILASKEKRTIDPQLVKNIGDEAYMPFSVGGGIYQLEQIRKLIGAGAEKVVINTFAVNEPDFIKEASDEFGSSTLIASMDIKRDIFGRYRVFLKNGTVKTKYSPIAFAKLMEEKGAGELLINNIEKDGTYKGYDLEMVRRIAQSLSIPTIALGGASNIIDMKDVILKGYANASAAGSIFVFHGPRKAVLINYPTKTELNQLLSGIL